MNKLLRGIFTFIIIFSEGKLKFGNFMESSQSVDFNRSLQYKVPITPLQDQRLVASRDNLNKYPKNVFAVRKHGKRH